MLQKTSQFVSIIQRLLLIYRICDLLTCQIRPVSFSSFLSQTTLWAKVKWSNQIYNCIFMRLNTATNGEYPAASLLVLAVSTIHSNEFISLMSSPLLFNWEGISDAMSNGTGSIMPGCDRLQIRTTTHISTQVIIWISASRWWWKQDSPWSDSRVSADKHQGLWDTLTPAPATLTGSPHISQQGHSHYALHAVATGSMGYL